MNKFYKHIFNPTVDLFRACSKSPIFIVYIMTGGGGEGSVGIKYPPPQDHCYLIIPTPEQMTFQPIYLISCIKPTFRFLRGGGGI